MKDKMANYAGHNHFCAGLLLFENRQRRSLKSFTKVQPGGPGWSKVCLTEEELSSDEAWDVPTGVLCTLFGSGDSFCR